MNTNSVILIVSPPGDLQIGLQALLTTHLDIDVLVVGEATSALKIITRNNPVVVILDENIPGNIIAQLVANIKTNWLEIQCVVLVNDDQRCQEIIAAGADLIVMKGLPGAKLVAEIKSLLETKTANFD